MGLNRRSEWDRRQLAKAKLIASWSKDPSTKVGAVIVDGKRPVSEGYNGLPQGVKDLPDRLNNRDLKYKMIIHAERNAIIFARRDLRGCTLYTWPFLPCAACASMIIQAGIAEVVAPPSDNPRWQEDFALAKEMFMEAGVALRIVEVEEPAPPAVLADAALLLRKSDPDIASKLDNLIREWKP